MATRRSPPEEMPAPTRSWRDHSLSITLAWVLVVGVGALYYNQKSSGRLGRSASASVERISNTVVNGGLDGKYVCSSLDLPATVTIDGGTGSIDLGVASVRGMQVKRHGDTVSMSGGQAYDAEGRPVDQDTMRAISGGSDADLLTVGDDGQSLTLDLENGRKAKFVKQP